MGKPKVAEYAYEFQDDSSEVESVIQEDYSKMKMTELTQLCKDRNIKGISGKNKSQLIEMLNGGIIEKPKRSTKSSSSDTYSEEILKERYNNFHSSYSKTKELAEKYKLPIRCPNMPEDISENIAKFIIRGREGKNIKWSKAIGQSGDLYDCDEEKQLEVKTFMSDGPISFGPKEVWDIIYFQDARDILENKFILYCLPYSNISELWRNIKVNSTDTFEKTSQ